MLLHIVVGLINIGSINLVAIPCFQNHIPSCYRLIFTIISSGIAASGATVIILIMQVSAAIASLPPVPVPAENPITEEKRVLGKILFWDEQLSVDNSTACGTCHIPSAGGADPRFGIHPGKEPGSFDDIFGSPGVKYQTREKQPKESPLFGLDVQITAKLAPSNFGGLWADMLFWDGRAGSEFKDPLSGGTVIESGGALENQVLMTLSNDAEMAHLDFAWSDVTRKLETTAPLLLATNIPADIESALKGKESYPELFASAFGDAQISPTRIAMSIATYERTLVADQTPWDHYQAGDTNSLSFAELQGWKAFNNFKCANCHEPPLFTNNDFMNVGLQHFANDMGHAAVSRLEEDTGDMKVPSLRNAGLRSRFMHTGQFISLAEVLNFYFDPPSFEGRDDIPNGGAYNFTMDTYSIKDIRAFITNGLTDPRVSNETFPFDRPTLFSER